MKFIEEAPSITPSPTPSPSPSGLAAPPCHPSPCREGEDAPADSDALATYRGISPSLQGEGCQSSEGSFDGVGLGKGLGLRLIPFTLLALMAAVLVAATSYEHLHGTTSVLQVFYHAPWFIALWGLIAATGLVRAVRSKSCRRPAVMAIHAALLVILAGALATHLFGREGTLTLRAGQPPTALYLQPDNRVGHLPFALSADSLHITPGHPHYRDGHILYLMSPHADGHGCTLKVVKDTYGFPLSYAGYFLLLLSFIAYLTQSPTQSPSQSPSPSGLAAPPCYPSPFREGEDAPADGDTLAAFRGISPSLKGEGWQSTEGGSDGKGLWKGLRLWQRLPILSLLLFFTALYVCRGLLARHIPLTCGGEVWHFCALCAFALALKLRPVPCLAIGAVALGISYFSTGSLTAPAPPVLRSFWLSLHVSIIVLAYALLAYLAVVPSRRVLRWGVGTLAVGIFLGAAWAGQAWGRCWGWDPKEVWALITLLVYALPLHAESLPGLRTPRHLRIYLRLAFLTVLFTYFGVNYLLGGLHGYVG